MRKLAAGLAGWTSVSELHSCAEPLSGPASVTRPNWRLGQLLMLSRAVCQRLRCKQDALINGPNGFGGSYVACSGSDQARQAHAATTIEPNAPWTGRIDQNAWPVGLDTLPDCPGNVQRPAWCDRAFSLRSATITCHISYIEQIMA